MILHVNDFCFVLFPSFILVVTASYGLSVSTISCHINMPPVDNLITYIFPYPVKIPTHAMNNTPNANVASAFMMLFTPK